MLCEFLSFVFSLCPIICFSQPYSYPGAGVVGEEINTPQGNEANNILSVSNILPVPDDLVYSKIFSAFKEYNNELREYNHLGALIAWNISTDMTPQILELNQKYVIEKNIWNNHWCSELLKVYHDPGFGHFQYPWEISLLRQLYLICRGPRFSSYQLSNVLAVLSSLQKLYNKEVCIPSLKQCLRMEPDLNRFMEKNRSEPILRETWIAWHKTIGGEVKPLYASLIRMLNQGAKQAGFRDMGECWREELEMQEDLRELATKLYSDVKYLYSLLHAFVRHKLEKYYGLQFQDGFIPAHLLANMWHQNWENLIDILWEDEESFEDEMNSDGNFSLSSPTLSLVKQLIPSRNASVLDMIKVAESFYVSMGLPHLPDSFWKNSYFQDEGKNGEGEIKANSRNCHGSAANMFGDGDFRMMMCAELSDQDLITIHHEIGHIMYFMAYSKLPTLFQEGANTAFHEAVGDSVTYDLLNSKVGNKINMKSLLKTGLAKLPQIGFGLIMDLWRWELFENPDKVKKWNDVWWQLNEDYLGITRPYPDYNLNGDSLDAAGKFHIIDNIPYIRYFFASFLQLQFYEAMCKASNGKEITSDAFMHYCQIKGSKNAGRLLWKMMEQGASRHWSEILEEMTGTKKIESRALLRYFKPLKNWLEKQIKKLRIKNVGW